jgi:uncharacterized protein YhaN
MRLTALTLNRYGNFDNERMTFDARPGVLNLLLAPNGSGKSVLRAAFCDLLFGIGGQTPMGFRYGYPGMRITAEAIDPNQEPFAFGRRKGQGNTLVDNQGVALDPAKIARLLGGTDRPRLERLFAVDTERLRLGESDLLASDGELGAALVSGAGGAHDLRAMRKSLEATRDNLAPIRRSSQRPFYLALDRFVDARKRVDSSLLRPEQWQRQQQDLDAAEQCRSEQNRIADVESAEIARLERVRRVMPWLAAHDTVEAWLRDNPDAPVLDAALAPRLAEARSAIVMAEQRVLRERETAAHLVEQIGQIVVDDVLLREVAEIERLAEATGAARKAMIDLPAVTARALALAELMAARLRELGSPLPVERAGDAIPPRAAVTRARRLIQAYTARQEAVQVAPGRIAELERERDTVVAQLLEPLMTGDNSDLEVLVKEIRVDGDPARRRRDAAAMRSETAETLAAMLARVPGWTLGDAALVALSPLLPDTYERHAAEVAEKRSEAATCLDLLQSARRAREEARERLAAATKSVPLLDDAALHRARGRRDDGWQLIYRRLFTADQPTLLEEQSFTGPLPLPLAYERAVTNADAIADRHIREVELLERSRAAQTTLHDAEAGVYDAETRHAHAVQARQAVERNWTQICGMLPLGDHPTIRDVHGFLAARDRVIEARRAHLAAAAAETALQASHANWTARLSAMLAVQGEATLFAPLAAADKHLAEAQQAGRDRAVLEARREAADKALAEALVRQRQAEIALAEWRDDWARATQELGRAADEDPRMTEDILQVYTDLEQGQTEIAALQEHISGMRRDLARFGEEAQALAARVAPDLDPSDPFLLVGVLRQTGRQAGELAKQRDLLREQSFAASRSTALAERQLAECQTALRAILVLVGAESVDAAEHRLVLAAERARQAASLAEAEAKLRETGDLWSLTKIRDEVATAPIEDIPGQIDRAVQRRKQAQVAAQEAAATASALAQRMQQVASETDASDAVADQQSAIATIGRVLEEALVHHVAAEMLDCALVTVEQQNQSLLLQRIGALFSRLTGGAYTRVLTEIGDDNVTHLILQQHDFPDERQSVRELSEGTRDQLYLALRLAAIEEHAAIAPALPFIGDDILQTFDDDRALAAMQVLQEISQRVQVILLTHHRHVLDLAARLPSGSVHVCRIGGVLSDSRPSPPR